MSSPITVRFSCFDKTARNSSGSWTCAAGARSRQVRSTRARASGLPRLDLTGRWPLEGRDGTRRRRAWLLPACCWPSTSAVSAPKITRPCNAIRRAARHVRAPPHAPWVGRLGFRQKYFRGNGARILSFTAREALNFRRGMADAAPVVVAFLRR